MPPTPQRVSTDDDHDRTAQDVDDDLRQYEVDGWQLGYQVELNGVGVVEMHEGGGSDSSDFPDTDPDTDVEMDEHPSGYRAIPCAVGGSDAESEEEEDQVMDDSTSEGEDVKAAELGNGGPLCSSDNVPVASLAEPESSILADAKALFGSNVSPPIAKEFQKLMNQSCSPLHGPIAHVPNDISLDENKLDEIRNAMEGFQLTPPPHWASTIPSDETLLDQIKKIVN